MGDHVPVAEGCGGTSNPKLAKSVSRTGIAFISPVALSSRRACCLCACTFRDSEYTAGGGANSRRGIKAEECDPLGDRGRRSSGDGDRWRR